MRIGYLTPGYRGPKRGQKCYVTLTFLGFPIAKRGDQNNHWLLHRCLLGGPKGGPNTVEPLHFVGFQFQARGSKSEVAASPLTSQGPKKGQKCYGTSAFLGVPNTKHRERNKNRRPHPCLLGDPKEGRNAMSPLQSWDSQAPSAEMKIISGYFTAAFLGAQNKAQILCNP